MEHSFNILAVNIINVYCGERDCVSGQRFCVNQSVCVYMCGLSFWHRCGVSVISASQLFTVVRVHTHITYLIVFLK